MTVDKSQWFGLIPNEWSQKKLKYIVNLRSEKCIEISNEKYIGLENIESKTGRYISGISENIVIEGTSNRFYQGDILFGKLRPYLAKCIEAEFDGIGTTELLVMNPNRNIINTSYLKFIMLTPNFIDYINSSTYGTKMPRANWEFIGDIQIIFPNLFAQSRIVSFLTQKISDIDHLIYKKELLIRKLEQQRQSIITEAVTKGLNPNVKMKDSGVEWIGEIPEHWKFSKLGYLGRLQNGISKPAEAFGYGSPFVTYSDVYKNEVIPSNVVGLVNSNTEDQKIYSVEKGDIFFTRTSETIEEIGIASTSLENIENATFAGFLIRFRPSTTLLYSKFARYYFRGDLRKHYFVKEMNIVTRASLSQGVLRNFPVLLPPYEEQENISIYLEEKTEAIRESITKINAQIEKLKEYRQSLIYEAVTGKIDVSEMELEEVR